jgi:LPS O-antigen subunit length determinant protein (WzzB/FepE family)
MQGILRSHYKTVEEYLNKLQEENLANQYCPYYETIFEHKAKLYDIYKNYRETFEQMTMIVKQFEEHKQSVKRLIIMQKNKKKEMQKLSANSSKSFVVSKEKVILE